MEITIRTSDPNTQVFVDGVQRVGPAAGGGSPTPTPTPTPTPAPVTLSGAPAQFDNGGSFTWPIRSQMKPTIGCMGHAWKRMQLYVPQPGVNGFLVKPNNLGKLNIAEPTGYDDYDREVLVFADGAMVFNNTATPEKSFGRNFTIGNPNFRAVGASFNLQPGQLVTVFVRSPLATPLDRTSFFFEWQSPERY